MTPSSHSSTRWVQPHRPPTPLPHNRTDPNPSTSQLPPMAPVPPLCPPSTPQPDAWKVYVSKGTTVTRRKTFKEVAK